MKFLMFKLMILTYLVYVVMPFNLNRRNEASTLFEMFNSLRGSASPRYESNSDQFSFKEKHRKYSKSRLESFATNKTAETTNNSTTPKETNFVSDLEAGVLEDWFTVKSDYFRSMKFPAVQARPGAASVSLRETQRVNDNFEVSKTQGAKTDKFFWFKLKSGYIYYFATKNDMNVLDAILINSVEDMNIPGEANDKLPTCLYIYDFQKNKFEICTGTLEMKLRYLCSIQNFLKNELDDRCIIKKNDVPPPIIKKEFKQVIIIPKASKNCNEGWNYMNKGNDWECTCKDGITQSPIDLPEKVQATPTTLTPMFTYDRVNVNAEESTIDGLVEGGKKINIRYEKSAIRIFHPNMGKIVAIDGSVYIAEEIVFHTPSEHKINGQQFDMEMQVIHYGRSKGDIANQVVLSILFKSSPGHYNKFLDKIDFFNLPNQMDSVIELQHDFFIPSVFLDSDAEDILSMEPFSFYNYEGSLTFPPCTERTTYFISADPIPLSNTVIQLFKEALNKPDVISKDEEGNIKGVVLDASVNENNREIQELNGRTVYLFDHILNGCITYQPPKRNIKKAGHYEKITKTADEFIFVNGNTPTGIPGSFVVSEKDAYGHVVQEIPK